MQAVSPNDVLGYLREQGFTPVSVNEISASVRQVRGPSHRRSIKSSELAALCWQLTTMVEGGIPITTTLDTISET